MNLIRSRSLFISIISLIMGGLIYLAFRPDTLVIFYWLKLIKLDSNIYNFREIFQPYGKVLPNWLLFSAPNGLWMLAFSGLMAFIWKDKSLTTGFYLSGLLWITSITSELMQYAKLISGVFDFNDIIFYTIGFFSFFLLLRLDKK